MSLRDTPLGETKSPLRWPAVLSLLVAAIAALGLVMGHGGRLARPEALGPLRRAADGAAAPIGQVLSTPVRWVGAGAAAVGDYLGAGAQNRRLKAELREARRWKDVALALAEQNARYRALMGIRTEPPIALVAARTILDARGPFANTRLADAGSDKGIVEGNPVLSERGLVGRVVGVSPGVSRILLLTDVESRTPVMLPRTNARAILTGDGGPHPTLAYLRSHDPLRPGDRVMTSGDGGVFPRGLPVGVAVKAASGAWQVALDADTAPIDYVRILLFRDFAQIVAPEALAPKALPSAMTEEPAATILGPAGTPPGPPAAAGGKAP